MSYKFRVWSLEAWGNEEDGFTVNDRREVGKISVANTENRTLFRALGNAHYLSGHDGPNAVDFDGDEEMILVEDAITGEPLFQLELEEFLPVKRETGLGGMFSQPNPLSSLSTAETVGLVAAGVAVVGTIGYFIWKSTQPTASQVSAANMPVVQTMPPIPGTTDQVPPFVPGFQQPTGGQVYDRTSAAAAPSCHREADRGPHTQGRRVRCR